MDCVDTAILTIHIHQSIRNVDARAGIVVSMEVRHGILPVACPGGCIERYNLKDRITDASKHGICVRIDCNGSPDAPASHVPPVNVPGDLVESIQWGARGS